MTSSIPTINFLPEVINWQFQAGATWQMNFTWRDSSGNPIDLTGYTAALMMRTSYQAVTPTVDISSVPNAEGQITIPTPLTGEVFPEVFDTHTATIVVPDFAPVRLVYDIELTSAGGIVYPIMRGEVYVGPEATR